MASKTAKQPADKSKAKKTASAPKKATAAKPAARKPAKAAPAKNEPVAKTVAKPTKAKGKAEPAEKVEKAAAAKAKAKPAAKKPKDGDSNGKPSKRAGKALVIVESPAKARTIKKYLGANFTVKASVGHIKDLPKSKLGVDVEHGFEPEYVVIRDKKKVIAEIRKAAESVEEVFLAPDPDREGEAIAWHIAEEIRPVNANIKRVLFNEITRKGITEALKNPTVLDLDKTNAQQARRILDRLVGYEISPLLWKKVRRGLSAGRVQSVAVRMLCDREQEIAAFVPEEYWTVDCDCQVAEPPPFVAKIWRFDGDKAEPKTADAAEVIAAELRGGPAAVATVEQKERRRRPVPPFITSKLQQEAARKLRFTAKKTMAMAQRLYEGIELGQEGPVGLITYMRTDSTRLAEDAVTAAREYITQTYGPEYLPEQPIVYKTSKKAQDAHEAIRPTSTEHTPEMVRAALKDAPEGTDLSRLYELIWNRFVACQMMPAIYDQTTVDIERGRALLRATGQVLRFKGYLAAYARLPDEEEEGDGKAASDDDKLLPPMKVGDPVELLGIRPEQHFTQPPPRFTEASLVKELEEKGIGRPSTYATILSTIVDRGYVDKRERRFFPTELGTLVNGLLVESFPDILNADFTAKMENELDSVEEGERDWRVVLGEFYDPFKIDLEKARETMRDVKREEIPTDFVCEKCANKMVIKWGRNGSFLACSGYPECRSTKEIERKADGTYDIVPEATTNEVCADCQAAMKVKRGKFGSFLACSRYPDCKFTKAISLGVSCPKENCGGFVTEKRSRRGKVFFGCSNYAKTQCDFVSWDRPIPQACPDCKAPFLIKKENRSGITIKCLSCQYVSSGGEPSEEQAAAS